MEGFERFTQARRSSYPKVSIRKRGQIGFNKGSINKFNLDNFNFVVLYMNKAENKIALKFTNDPNEEGAAKLVKRKGNYFISGKAFLDYYGISYAKNFSMTAIWDKSLSAVIIHLRGDKP